MHEKFNELYHRQRFVSPLLHFHACIVHWFVFILMKGKCGESSGCWASSLPGFSFFWQKFGAEILTSSWPLWVFAESDSHWHIQHFEDFDMSQQRHDWTLQAPWSSPVAGRWPPHYTHLIRHHEILETTRCRPPVWGDALLLQTALWNHSFSEYM